MRIAALAALVTAGIATYAAAAFTLGATIAANTIADTILTHSQSTDPASPHYGDQTREYSAKRWVRFPFCEDDIAAAQIGETLLLEE